MLHLGRTVRLVWSIAPGWTLANILLAVLQGLLPLAGIYMTKLIIDGVTKGIGAADKSAAFKHVAWLIVIAGLIGLATALVRSLTQLVSEAQGQVVTDHISDMIHAKSIEVDLEYYENSKYYDVLHRAQQEAPYRPARIVSDLVGIGQSGISLVAVVGLLLKLNWLVGIIIVAAAIPGAYLRVKYSGRLYAWQRDTAMADRMSWYYHWLLTDGTRAKEVRLFDLGGVVRRWFVELRRRLRRERLTLTAKRSAGDFASGAAATLAVFGTFAYIAWETIQGVVTLGGMVAYYQAFQLGLTSLQAVMSGFASLYEDNLFLTQFYEFTHLERTVAEPSEPQPVPRPIRDGVVFDRVSFAYPDTDRRAIDSVSLTIKPGEVAALVGPNGSGKTTLVKLLCRLYDPSGGRITIDRTPLERFEVVDLRRAISVVFQDYAEYQLSARRNIWIGNVELAEDDPAVERAARDAGADEVIRGLHDGYDTVLGKWFEDGEELSVGEWQKIALARAFVRDAEILVFDEPTSALDPLAEWKAFEQIRELAQGRAVILISHRFSTVHLADHIHLVERGRIVESGSHDELIALGGTYAEMYEVQAQAFQRR